MDEKQMKAIIGGIFGTGTYTVFDENGKAIQKKEKFNIRLYRDLWDSGAIKKLKGNKLGVFLTIAIHADNEGEGWPSQKTIATKLGINTDTVNRAIQSLEKDGFIEREIVHDENNRCVGTVYKLRFAPDLSEEKKEKPSPKIVRVRQTKESEKETEAESEKPNRKIRIGKSESEKPNRKIRIGKSETKNDISFKDDPLYKDDPLKEKQQQESDPVVVVQNLVRSLFEQELTERETRILLKLANNDVEKLKKDIITAFQYNPRPDSLMALLRYVVTSWDYSSKKKQEEKKEEEMPKVFQQEENNDNSSSEIPKVDPEARARIMNQLSRMRQRLNQRMNGGNLQ